MKNIKIYNKKELRDMPKYKLENLLEKINDIIFNYTHNISMIIEEKEKK